MSVKHKISIDPSNGTKVFDCTSMIDDFGICLFYKDPIQTQKIFLLKIPTIREQNVQLFTLWELVQWRLIPI